ncbi:MAG TPA: hypothetical protein VJ227_01980 [Patescibacteria group bacterium]|nr:hypothetical protein [Patescibacteria group bacterium]
MAIFKKREEEDLEDEEELTREERKKDRKFSKKFKDLNPKNRKKRKEPPKPWGRFERLLVLIVFAATFIVSAILAISARGGFSPGSLKPDFSKINFDSLNVFKEETIIIRKK